MDIETTSLIMNVTPETVLSIWVETPLDEFFTVLDFDLAYRDAGETEWTPIELVDDRARTTKFVKSIYFDFAKGESNYIYDSGCSTLDIRSESPTPALNSDGVSQLRVRVIPLLSPGSLVDSYDYSFRGEVR